MQIKLFEYLFTYRVSQNKVYPHAHNSIKIQRTINNKEIYVYGSETTFLRDFLEIPYSICFLLPGILFRAVFCSLGKRG